MIRIVLSGIFYPMAILRYFEAALRRRADVDLFTVGPYTGAWIPWAGGMNLPQKYATAPNLPLGGSAHQTFPAAYVEAQLPWKPDLWLQVDAGFYFSGRPKSGRNFIIGTDPHVLNYNKQRKLADRFFCMQACYSQNGDHYLPYAYDPIWHAPERQPKKFDVCLIGLHYENRNRLVDELRRHGLNIYYDLGPVYDEARTLYNQAPIGLNWSSLNDLTARVFELLGFGRLAIVNHVPDLPNFFADGVDLVTFEDLPTAVEKTLYFAKNPDLAAEIAARGHETVKPHTWDTRVGQILQATRVC